MSSKFGSLAAPPALMTGPHLLMHPTHPIYALKCCRSSNSTAQSTVSHKGWNTGKPPQPSTKKLPSQEVPSFKSLPRHKASPTPPHEVLNVWQPPSQLPLLPCTLPHLLIFTISRLPQGHPVWPFTKTKKNAKGSCSAATS